MHVARLLGLIALILLALVAAFVFVIAPLRARRTESTYARFRAGFQAAHDTIDAQFNHQDRVVNGIQWH